MDSNTGVIFGRVTWPNGIGIPLVELALNFVFMDGVITVSGSDDMGGPVKRVRTGFGGFYAMPFYWDPAFSTQVLANGWATASVYAHASSSDGTLLYANKHGRLIVTIDVRRLITTAVPALPESGTDLANALKDFWASYREMLPKGGTFLTPVPMSTEVSGLIGVVDLVLKP